MLNNVRSPKSRLCDDLDGTYIWYYDHYRICWINTFCFSVTFYLFLSRLRRHRKQTSKNQVETKQYVLWWVPALHLESVLLSMHWSVWYLLYIIVLDVFTGTVYVTICFLCTIYTFTFVQKVHYSSKYLDLHTWLALWHFEVLPRLLLYFQNVLHQCFRCIPWTFPVSLYKDQMSNLHKCL